MPRIAATATTGPELYPPTPITTSGLRRDINRQASTPPSGTSAAPRARGERLPFQPRAANEIERELGRRNHARFDSGCRAGERNLRIREPSFQRAGHSQPGKQVAAGAASRNDDAHCLVAGAPRPAPVAPLASRARRRFALAWLAVALAKAAASRPRHPPHDSGAVCWDTLSKIPMPSRLISRDDPP